MKTSMFALVLLVVAAEAVNINTNTPMLKGAKRRLLGQPGGGSSHPGPATYKCSPSTTFTAAADGNTVFGVGGEGEAGRTYENDMTCTWHIKPTLAKAEGGIAVVFNSFHIENRYDFVEIYKGASAVKANLIANLTGEFVTPKVVDVEKATEVFVRFVADDSFHKPGTHSAYAATTFALGFKATYWDISEGKCVNSCSGQGTCTDGRCHCNTGFVGDDCSIVATEVKFDEEEEIRDLCIGCWGYRQFTLTETTQVLIEVTDIGHPESDPYLAFKTGSPPTLINVDGQDWFNWYYDTNDIHLIRGRLAAGTYFVGVVNHPARAVKNLNVDLTVRKGNTPSEWPCVSQCFGHGTCDTSKGSCVCDPGFTGEHAAGFVTTTTCKYAIEKVTPFPFTIEKILRVGDWALFDLEIPANKANKGTLLLSLASRNARSEPILIVRKGKIPRLDNGFLPTVDAFEGNFVDQAGFELLNGREQNILIKSEQLTAGHYYVGVFNLWGHTGLEKESHDTARFTLYFNDFQAGIPCPRNDDQFCSDPHRCDFNTGKCNCPIHKLGLACGLDAEVVTGKAGEVVKTTELLPGESAYFVVDVTNSQILGGHNLLFTATKEKTQNVSRSYPFLLARKGQVPFQDNYTYWDDHDLTAHFYHDDKHEILLDREELSPGAWYFSLTNSLESEENLKYSVTVQFLDKVSCPTGNQGGKNEKELVCTGFGTCDEKLGRCKCTANHTLDDCSGHGLFQLKPNSKSTPEQSPDIPIDAWVFYSIEVPCENLEIQVEFNGKFGDRDAAPLLVIRRDRLPLMMTEASDYWDYYSGASRHYFRQAIRLTDCPEQPCVVSQLAGQPGTNYALGYPKPGIYFIGIYNDFRLAQTPITNYSVSYTLLGAGCDKKTCGKGFGGSQCSVTCPGMNPDFAYSNTPFSNGVPCSGYGNCKITDSSATCECDDMHFGSDCQQVCPSSGTNSSTKKACDGHGQCVANSEGLTTCKCDNEWQGDFCELSCPGSGTKAGTCSGHGQCGLSIDDNQKQIAVCKCDPNWLGSNCSQTCENNCGGPKQGTCQMIHSNNFGNSSDWITKCKCNAGFAGEFCEKSCPGNAEGKPCSGHGKCELSEDTSEPVCKCFSGRHGLDCSEFLKCKNNCTQRGDCLMTKGGDLESNKGSCYCDKRYVGDDCSVACPGNLELDGPCNDRGSCSLVDNNAATCKCFNGYTGVECLADAADQSSKNSSFNHYGTLAIVLVLVACVLLLGMGYLFVLARRRKKELDKWRNPLMNEGSAVNAELQETRPSSGDVEEDAGDAGFARPVQRLDDSNEDQF